MAGTLTCPKCQKVLPEANKFCNQCGSPLSVPRTSEVYPEATSAGPQFTTVMPPNVQPGPNLNTANPGYRSMSLFSKLLLLAIIFVFLLSASGGIYYFFLYTPADEIILRLHGSNTLGSKLIPALAEVYLKQQGATDVKTVPTGREDEVYVRGIMPGERAHKSIEVFSHGSKTAFEDLRDSKCDIGLASRQINGDELRMLSGLGDFTAPPGENVLGLDGIAVIVHGSNNITSLRLDQIKDIFTGKVRSWRDLGYQGGTIQVYARDDKSGTFDFFKSRVLNGEPLVATARRYEDSAKLSLDVSSDQNGIGFIALPFVKPAKMLSVSEKGTNPMYPTAFTVATEDYPISRRLFLYVPSRSQNKFVREFVKFALDKEGQSIVSSQDFVGQNVFASSVTERSTAGNSPEIIKVTDGAKRLSTNFRFKTGSSELDSKAVVDLDRVISTLKDLNYSGRDVILLGFADNVGNPEKNKALSATRANAIAEQFRQRGVNPSVVQGLGQLNPVASNDTPQGREKNRRVEIWVKH